MPEEAIFIIRLQSATLFVLNLAWPQQGFVRLQKIRKKEAAEHMLPVQL